VEGVGNKLFMDNYFSLLQLFSGLYSRKINFVTQFVTQQARHAKNFDFEIKER
jgi:hypothetical protein